MKNFVKILFVVIIAIVIGGISIYFGVKTYNSKNVAFKDAGYIISTDDGSKESTKNTGDVNSTKYFFDGSESFREGYSKNVTFKDTSKEEIKLENNNFIHYNDGSVGAFKTVSLVNLNAIDGEIIKYYNLPVGTTLTKSNGSNYIAKTISENIEFSNILLKIDENKYMLLANNIDVVVNNETKNIKNSYLEIQFFDGNIVRLENNDVKIQNIADSFYIYLDNGVMIDLSNKNIYLNKVKKLNMGDITINSNDNINLTDDGDDDIIKDKEALEESKKKEEESQKEKEAKDKAEKEEAENKINNNESNAINIGENPLNGITNGVVNPARPDTTEEVVDEKNEYDPVFTISNLSISPNGISAEITHEDKSGVLKGASTLTLINAETNKVVDKMILDSGLATINYQNETLTQNTNYVLVVNSDYTKNGTTLNKDFVQKSFMTSSIGVDVSKDYFSETSLNFIVNKSNSSEVQKLTAKLLDKDNNVVKSEDVDFAGSNNASISFEGLKANTKYTLRLESFMFKNSVISDNFSVDGSYQTLKRTPTIGGISYTIDKVNGKFVIGVDNVTDKDNGIKNIRYEIYDARSLSSDADAKPIKTINKDGFGTVDVLVDDETIERGKPYVFKAIAEFNDNEKIVELEKGYSDVFQLDGKVHPTVRFDKDSVTFERIKGTLNIVDEYGTVDYTKPITIVYSDSHGISNTLTFSNASSKIPIDVNGLRANNETYTFNVYGTIDLGDNYGAVNQLIGTFVVNTSNIKSFTLSSSVDEGDVYNVFSVKARLRPTNNEDNTLEANTLTNLTFNLYDGSDTTGRKIKSVSVVDFNEDPYTSDLKPIYYDKTFTITPETFGLTNSYLKAYNNVTVEVTNANDYTKWPNTSPIINNTISIKVKDALGEDDSKQKITLNMVRNKDVSGEHHDKNLLGDTYVGVKVQSTYDNTSRYAKYVNYYIFNKDDPNTPVASKEKIPVNDDGSIPSYTFYLKNGTSSNKIDNEFVRGNSYYATYVINIDYDGDGVVDTDKQIPLTGVYASDTFKVPKQNPVFETYPSTSDGKTINWNYKMSDVDNALIKDQVYFKLNNNDVGVQNITENSKFQTLNIPFTEEGTLNLYTYVRTLKDWSNSNEMDKELTITNQDIQKMTTVPSLNFVLTEEVNRVILTIPSYASYRDFFNKVTNIRATFKSNNQTKTFDNLEIDDTGNIIFDLDKLEDFMGQDIEVNLYIDYDSNNFGFDTTSSNGYVLKEAEDGVGTGNYYYLQGNTLYKKPTAYGSNFSFDLNKVADSNNKYKFVITNNVNSKNSTYNLNIDDGGFLIPDESAHFYPSVIKQMKVNTSNNVFSFDRLVPGISLKDTSTGKYLIDAGLTDASINIKTSGDFSSIKDNKIYIELYKTDENMLEANSQLINTYEFDIKDLNEAIMLDGLEPSSYYYFKVYANMTNGGKTELYDIDEKNNTTKYPIQTLGNITLKESNISYDADSYEDKYLKLSYTLDKTKGIDHISYELFRVVNNGEATSYISTGVEIPDTAIVNLSNTVNVKIPPSSGITAGNVYTIGITAYLKKTNGELVKLDPIYTDNINFTKLVDPYIYVRPIRNASNNSIKYSVKVIDTAKTIVNGAYTVRFEDANGKDITPSEYTETYYEDKDFTISDVNLQANNYIIVKYKVNLTNSPDESDIQEKESRTRVNPLSSEGINVGDVYATTNKSDSSKINLTFSGSTKLDRVKKIRYIIIKDGSSTVSDSVTENLTLSSSSCGSSTCYQTTLSAIINDTGIYYIQVQFIDGSNKVVDERVIDYVYTI